MNLLDFSFTPSEFILLNGDKFSPEFSGENSLHLLCSEGSVDGMYLASLMCAAAFLANENESALTLELVQKKKIFGLWESTKLVVRPAGPAPNWNGLRLNQEFFLLPVKHMQCLEIMVFTILFMPCS